MTDCEQEYEEIARRDFERKIYEECDKEDREELNKLDKIAREEWEGQSMSVIKIKKSKTADTRSCDFSQVTKSQLAESSRQHIGDVRKGLDFMKELIDQSGSFHDHDKLTELSKFHADFITGFKQTDWWDNHRKINRHHLLQEDGIPKDVNLIDVLDMIVDCVMAGMGRTGNVYPLDIKPEVLMSAFQNTVTILKDKIVVEDE